MINLKKTLAIGAMILTIGATSVPTFAASIYKTPAEAVAGITGKSIESVTAEKSETGKSYGEIAKEAGKLEEFKAENLEIKKDNLNAKVAEGKITQEKADEIIATITERQANCDGTNPGKIGKANGAGFGTNEKAIGKGMGKGKMNGLGKGQKNGMESGNETTSSITN